MSFLSADERKKERLERIIEPGYIISRRIYNLIFGGVVLYGLLANVILCSIDAVANIYQTISPIAFLIAYFALAIAGILITNKSNNPIISFIGYNMVCLPMGVCVSMCVSEYGGLDSTLVQQAFLITAITVGVMITASLVMPELFSKIGSILFIVLLCLVVTELVLLLFGVRQIITSWIAAILFSFYIGFDIYRSQQFEPCVDNAIDCALDVYMDIINHFLRILRLLGSSKSND